MEDDKIRFNRQKKNINGFNNALKYQEKKSKHFHQDTVSKTFYVTPAPIRIKK
jgi:hypothetical protein